MRFDLTQASHRIFERASQLRLHHGTAAVSTATLLWALFEEDECRAAQWLKEAKLTIEQFKSAFAIETLRSPISAPSFPIGSYGVPAEQYTPPDTPPTKIEAVHPDNSVLPIGKPFPETLQSKDYEHAQQIEQQDEQQDGQKEMLNTWDPTKQPKYSLYSKRMHERTSASHRLQFYLDEQRINVGLLTPELEDTIEMVAHRFIRQDNKQSITVASGGIKRITLGMLSFTLTTEHLLLAVVLDTGDVGRWLRENGFETAELYQRIDDLTTQRRQTTDGRWQQSKKRRSRPSSAVSAMSDAVDSPSLYRLLDAAANRGREAMRVIEDYVRFILDDADLTQQLKTFRHQFQEILRQYPMQLRLEARNTEYDVGTDISVEGEYQRVSVDDVLSANFSRLQESLRSLEEFSKMFDSQSARQFEQLRYQCYTLHKTIGGK